MAITMLSTSAATAGFLVWNWPPAKIFMGDCGSGLLGFVFGCIAVVGPRHGSLSPAAAWMLIAVFFADASLTLARRILAGEAWHKPHRSHAYQRAVQLGRNHAQVTSAACLLFGVAAVLSWQLSANDSASLWPCLAFGIGLFLIWTLIHRLYSRRNHYVLAVTGTSLVSGAKKVLVGLQIANRNPARRISMHAKHAGRG